MEAEKDPSSLKDHLEELRKELIRTLKEKIKDGTATAGDLSVARALLKDHYVDINGLDVKPKRHVAGNLPFESETPLRLTSRVV